MEGSWNRDVLDIREIQFLVPLPSKETFDIKEIKVWIGFQKDHLHRLPGLLRRKTQPDQS